MPRLFVAIELNAEIKAHIAELQMGMPEARWTHRNQLHLTLRFIGDVSPKTMTAIDTALSDIEAAPFALRLRDLGHFPPKGKPRILSAQVDDCPPLMDLQKQVEAAVVSVGIEAEGRRYSPHVTIARFQQPPSHNLLGRYYDTNEGFVTKAMQVDRFTLYSSVLSPSGARHKIESVYRLK